MQALRKMVEFPRYSAFLFCPDNRNSKTLKILTLHLQFNKVVKRDSTLSQLENLKVYSVESLQAEYILNNQSTFSQQNAILYDKNLYIQNDHLEDTDHLAVEISKLFGEPRGFDSFLISLFDKKSEDKIENLLRVKGIQELSDEERECFGITKYVPPEREILEKPEEREAKIEAKPIVITPLKMVTVSSQVRTGVTAESKPGASKIIPSPHLSEQIEWQPECKPEEAEIHFEVFQGTEYKGHKTPDVKRDDGKPRPALSDREDEVRDTLSPPAKKAIGRWGEECAFVWLKRNMETKYSGDRMEDTENGFIIYRNEQKIVEVQWLNKIDEKGEGYDIKVIENDREEYIEVKSTKTDTKDWFDMSQKQWEFLKDKEDKFHIYRIYNAGTKQPKLVDIQNPSKRWQEGELIAYPIRIQI